MQHLQKPRGWGPKHLRVYHKSQARGVLASREESAGILARRYSVELERMEWRKPVRSTVVLAVLAGLLAIPGQAQEPARKPIIKLEEVMIPMRDGVKLQTVILTPAEQHGPLPILFRRTPYGVPENPPQQMPASWKELAQDGYIFVIQNLRGRFKSEGAFDLTSQVDLSNPKSTNETTDAYDSIEWLVKNVPNNSGKVGMYGVSYDDFWKKEAWVRQLHASTVPNLNVAGFWDQEDPWGPWQIFRHAEEQDPDHTNFMVAGPWFHGQWQTPKADSIGLIPFAGHETAREFRENIEAPFFRHYLHGKGEKPTWQASTFQSGSNSWHTYEVWPPKEAQATNLYLHADGTLSFAAPTAAESAKAYREYISDPTNPVPYRQRPISPTYPAGDWRTWEFADQRFVDGRPDVLSFVSAPLDHDITVTGPLAAALFASTSGTDSDFVVKLIDVYPDNAQKNSWAPEDGPKPGQFAQSLNGYELPIAMEVRRGRYLQSFEVPHALAPNEPLEWNIPLRDHDHVFLKGHRIMVQIQSTWFPLIDRNPQKFVPSIYKAVASDFTSATQRIYCSPAMPSHVVLPVMH